MDFELRVAREKVEREQRERKARAKAKMDKEKRAKAEAARKRDALEAAQRVKQLDAQRAQLLVSKSPHNQAYYSFLFLQLLPLIFYCTNSFLLNKSFCKCLTSTVISS